MLYIDKLPLGSKRKYTDEGFLSVPARISRVGTQVYLAKEMGLTDKNPNDQVVIFRPESEVFDSESLSSFAFKPVTNDHPPELVTAQNSREFTVGMSGNDITKDGEYVEAQLNITDADAIKNIEKGKVELSNGYTADIDWTPGVHEGVNFDGIQRNIRGNHIAIVSKGRAGSSCRVADVSPEQKQNQNTMKVCIDDIDFEVPDQAGQAVIKLQKRLADAEKEVKEKEKEVEEKDEEMEEVKKEAKSTEDSLTAKLDDAKSKQPSPEQLDKLVADRSAFIDSAKTICPNLEYGNKDEATIKKEVVSDKRPNIDLTDKSDDYINAMFDSLLESDNSGNLLDTALTNNIESKDSKNEDNRSEVQKARDRMIADGASAWNKNKK